MLTDSYSFGFKSRFLFNQKQFTTRIQLENENIEVVEHMKILGTTINNTLSWDKNTEEIVKKVNKRMLLLKKIIIIRHGGPMEDLLSVNIGTISCSLGSIPDSEKKKS